VPRQTDRQSRPSRVSFQTCQKRA